LLGTWSMNHGRILMLATVVSVPLGGCSHSDTMSDDYVSMQATLSDAEVENQQHAEACGAAPSMPEMTSELVRHEESMNGIMAHMDEARGHMGDGSTGMGMRHCTGSSFDHMSSTVDDVHSTMSGHITRMRSAESLDAARSECSTYAGVMDGLTLSMMSDVESMSCMRR
jgi:hypothetical protein